jgi:cytochrome c biogenesis protein CcdA
MSKLSALRSFAILSCAILLSSGLSYVQRNEVPARVEGVIRISAFVAGIVVVPILLILAWHVWIRTVRPSLSQWRNGVAGASLLILSVSWVFFVITDFIAFASHFTAAAPGVGVQSAFLLSSSFAAILALASRGNARIYAFAASILIWGWFESTIHV